MKRLLRRMIDETEFLSDYGVRALSKFHEQNPYVFEHAGAHAYERAGGDYYPKLQIAVPFTPVTGPRLMVRPGPQAEARRRMLIVAERVALASQPASS